MVEEIHRREATHGLSLLAINATNAAQVRDFGERVSAACAEDHHDDTEPSSLFDRCFPRTTPQPCAGCASARDLRMYAGGVGGPRSAGALPAPDAVMNFLKTGGRFGRRRRTNPSAQRTNYFRESYAYGD